MLGRVVRDDIDCYRRIRVIETLEWSAFCAAFCFASIGTFLGCLIVCIFMLLSEPQLSMLDPLQAVLPGFCILYISC